MEKTVTAGKIKNTEINYTEIKNTGIKFYKKQNILEIIVSRILNKNKIFTDDVFPPGQDSLYGKNKTRQNIDSAYEEDMLSLDKEKNWLNANEIFDSILITKNDFSPFDIVQGCLSDCYYMSALASIAKIPQLILNLFVVVDIEKLFKIYETDKDKLKDQKIIEELMTNFSQDVNKSNYYECVIKLNEFYQNNFDKLKCFIMKIRIHGEWKYILIDSYLPVYQNTNELIFGKSYSLDLWVSLIEKVWAKVLGGYYKTSLGSPAEGFLSLTDSPTDVYSHKHLENSDELWNKIKNSQKENWILNCIIQLKGTKSKNYRNIGLITNHCYSIIRLAQTSSNGKSLKFLLLRNPHGHINYSGNYSDSDSKWNEKIKKDLDFYNKDDACFFLNLEDYFKLFDHTFVCKYEEGKVYKSHKISKLLLKANKGDGVFLFLKIKEEGEICFTLHQKYKRIYGKGIKNKIAQILISKISDEDVNFNNVTYLCGSSGNRSVNIKNYFKKGNYLLYSRIDTGLENKVGFVISYYADKLISENIEVNVFTDKIDENLILEKILISMCKDKLTKDFYSKDSLINSNCIDENEMSYKLATLNQCENGFGVIYLHNKNKFASINTTLTIKDFTGLKFANLKEKINQNKQISIVTEKLSENLIYFIKEKMKCGFKISFSETFGFTNDYLKSIIKTKGEKKEILLNNTKSGVNIYSIVHGKGYLFMIENTSKKNGLVKIIFTKLENLNSKEIKKDLYEKSLKISEKSFIELNTVDVGKPISIQYKYAVSLK